MDRVEKVSQFFIIILGLIALFTALNAVENIFAPLALALVAGVVLSPVSDFWERLGFPSVIGALVSLAATLVVMATFILVFQPVVAQLVAQAPKVWSDMQDTVEFLRGLMKGFSEVTDGMTDAIAPEASAQNGNQSSDDGMTLPSVTDALMLAPVILGQILVFGGALFFFLLSRGDIYQWAARRLSEPTERAQTARKLQEAERRVARYFLTITLINAGLGIATALALQVMGMPAAMLWGLVAFLLNFILYLGPAVLVFSLLFAGIAAFDGAMALLPAVTYLALNATEAQFVTPGLVGKHMQVNPLLIFLSLVFGLWLWGPIGGIVAIPLLLWVLVLSDGIKSDAAQNNAPERAA